jgi:hypothetical protein
MGDEQRRLAIFEAAAPLEIVAQDLSRLGMHRGGDPIAVLGIVKGDLFASLGGQIVTQSAPVEQRGDSRPGRPHDGQLALQMRRRFIDEKSDQLGA